MIKKKKVWLIFGTALVLLIAGIVVWSYFENEKGYEDYAPNARAIRLADPDLVYASSSWAGLCRNEEGEAGGCYSELYLYKSGRLFEETGWQGTGGEETSAPLARQLDKAVVDQVIERLRDSGIMSKDCPPREIMDAGWSYQVTLNGVIKTFDNPSDECEEIFDDIDLLIYPVEGE
jgi:hypothetical protein